MTVSTLHVQVIYLLPAKLERYLYRLLLNVKFHSQ